MNIRRKRRVAVAGGVLAAAAVIVPVAVLAAARPATADGIDPARRRRRPSTDRDRRPRRRHRPTDPGARGRHSASPRVGRGATYHRGRRTERRAAAGADYTDAADARRPGRGLPHGDRTDRVRRPDRGRRGRRHLPTVRLADGDRTRRSARSRSSTTDDELLVVDGEARRAVLGESTPTSPRRPIIGDGDCALESGCHPFLDDGNFDRATPTRSTTRARTPRRCRARCGSTTPPTTSWSPAQTESTATPGRAAGSTTAGRRALVFETCETQVLDISPDGELRRSAPPAYGDGSGPATSRILDGATGDEVARYDPRGGLRRPGWPGPTTPTRVATVYDDGTGRSSAWASTAASRGARRPGAPARTEVPTPYQPHRRVG